MTVDSRFLDTFFTVFSLVNLISICHSDSSKIEFEIELDNKVLSDVPIQA